ncbi:MAG: iron-sulfur cluster-binding domain-containing protein, partial [Proteobacteria bacterium]|nr:iron-sulfur cluster-binding domain-containing protein [Pseudomonadota bacterium]
KGEVKISEKTLEATRGVTSKIGSTGIALKVERITTETSTTKTLRLTAVDNPLPYFRAGQYINLFVGINGVSTSRPYTISSPPGAPWYDITVKRKKGGFVSHYLLDNVKLGDVFSGTIPSGDFYHNPVVHSRRLVLLAGGSGITPFMSIIRQAAAEETPLDIHLIFGSRNRSDIIFRAEIEALASQNRNIKADFVVSEPSDDWSGPSGFLDTEMISSLAGTLKGKTVLVCGPPLMHDLCGKALETLEVPKHQIKFEMTGPPDDVSLEKGWPGLSTDSEFEIVEERSGKRLSARAGEPIIVSLERSGIVAPAVCRSGSCTACRTRLVSGRVFVPDSVRVRRSDHTANYIHACMSYPLENLRIRL